MEPREFFKVADSSSTRTKLIRCLELFNQLSEKVEHAGYDHQEEIACASWTDELGRLRVWAANTGGLRTGQSSLDFQLRDSSHVNRQIVKLLESLSRTINEVISTLSEGLTEASYDSDTLDNCCDDERPRTELQQLYDEVVTVLDCLYRMSTLIRKPAEHDLLVGPHASDGALSVLHDMQQIRDMHPQVDLYLVQRLERAISQRRRDLNTRARQQILGTEFKRAAIDYNTPKEDATCIDVMAKGKDHEQKQLPSESGRSRTALEIPEVTKSQPSGASAGSQTFQCRYCFFEVEYKDTRSWILHVLKDIKPYICVFRDCNSPDRMYETRREWAFHLATQHDVENPTCPLCKESLQNPRKFERHLARHLEELALLFVPKHDTEEDECTEDDACVPSFTCEPHTALDSADSESTDDDMEAVFLTELISFDVEPTGMISGHIKGLGSSSSQMPSLPAGSKVYPQDFDKADNVGATTISTNVPITDHQPSSKPRSRVKNALAQSVSAKRHPRGARSPRQIGVSPVTAADTRLPHDDELYVMKAFARHASNCSVCVHPYEVHRRGGSLCSKGHARALDVAEYIFNRAGQAFSTVELDRNRAVHVEIPPDCDVVRELLRAMEHGLRLRRTVQPITYDGNHPGPSRNFWSKESRYSALSPDRPSNDSRGSLYESDVKEQRRQKARRIADSTGALPVPAKDDYYY